MKFDLFYDVWLENNILKVITQLGTDTGFRQNSNILSS